MNFNKNTKQASCVKVPNLLVLCKHYFAYSIYIKKFDLEKFSTLPIGNFLIEVTFLSQMSTFLRNLNRHWKCRDQKEDFQTV